MPNEYRVTIDDLACFAVKMGHHLTDPNGEYINPKTRSYFDPIELPELVHCADCVYYVAKDQQCVRLDRQEYILVYFPPDGFCSFGKREERKRIPMGFKKGVDNEAE